MNKESPESLRDRLGAIVAFLPRLLEQGSSTGGRIERPGGRGLVRAVPVFSLSEIQQSFVRAAADHGWTLSELNWPQWAQTSEAEALRDRPEALAEATPEQLARLLTVLIRQDRFVGGTLDSAFNSGLITRILERAAAILVEIEPAAGQ